MADQHLADVFVAIIVADEKLDPDVHFWEIRRLILLRGDRRRTRRVASFQPDGVPAKKRSFWIGSNGTAKPCKGGFELHMHKCSPRVRLPATS